MLSYAAKPGWGSITCCASQPAQPCDAFGRVERAQIGRRLFHHDARPEPRLEPRRAIRQQWDGPFCLKGIVAVEDARRAVEIGAAIAVSNHGGRRSTAAARPSLAGIVDAVGDRIEVICDGGITRGTHVLKALSVGAKACSGGRLYLYALAAAGEDGVTRAIALLRAEMERGMKLMGAKTLADLGPHNLRWR